MKSVQISLQMVRPKETRQALGQWVRLVRQRAEWTQPVLALKSGVPVATLSRLEREGQGSVDAVTRVLQALGELDGLHAYIQERARLAALPSDLADLPVERQTRLRVRLRKAAGRDGP